MVDIKDKTLKESWISSHCLEGQIEVCWSSSKRVLFQVLKLLVFGWVLRLLVFMKIWFLDMMVNCLVKFPSNPLETFEAFDSVT